MRVAACIILIIVHPGKSVCQLGVFIVIVRNRSELREGINSFLVKKKCQKLPQKGNNHETRKKSPKSGQKGPNGLLGRFLRGLGPHKAQNAQFYIILENISSLSSSTSRCPFCAFGCH
jgi:hypothetical protein